MQRLLRRYNCNEQVSDSSYRVTPSEITEHHCAAYRFLRLERRDRVDDFICGHNGTGVVRDIDVEGSVHLFIRVARRRVFYHRDLVAKLSPITNSCLHTGVRYESYDDELMDAVLLELQIQICVGKAAGTPMLEGHDVAGSWCEFAANLTAPCPVFESLVRPGCFLNWRNVLPALIVSWTVSMMQRIEDAELRLSRRIEDLHHMRNALVGFTNALQALPQFAAHGNEIVVWVDHEKCTDRFFELRICHVLSCHALR